MIQVEMVEDVYMDFLLKILFNNRIREVIITMEGYNRIKELYLKSTNKDKFLSVIVKHLMKQPNMSELYLNEEKNLDDLVSYINKKAKEQAVNGVAIIQDDEVYSWAILYFTSSNEKLGIVKHNSVKQQEDQKADNNQLKLEI